jgi:hypothetical protein
MKNQRTKKRPFLFIAALLMAVAAGCGGGGGGVGNRGGDDVAPALAMAAPTPASRVSDVDFRAEAFYIQFSYTDTTPMQPTTMRVTLKMDSGAAQDITAYFSRIDDTTIKSTNLYLFTRTLFDLPTNDVSRVMTVTISINDYARNTGSYATTFTVYPYGPSVPPSPPS